MLMLLVWKLQWRTTALISSPTLNITALILLTFSLANYLILPRAIAGRHYSQAEKKGLFERSENIMSESFFIPNTGYK